MTNLECMICEAESVGEIDLDTRNKLLSTIYESSTTNKAALAVGTVAGYHALKAYNDRITPKKLDAMEKRVKRIYDELMIVNKKLSPSSKLQPSQYDQLKKRSQNLQKEYYKATNEFNKARDSFRKRQKVFKGIKTVSSTGKIVTAGAVGVAAYDIYRKQAQDNN